MQLDELAITKASDAQVFVIVNKVDDQLTGNLQGPLVIGPRSKRGMQVVLPERRWSTRHPLVALKGGAA